MESIYIIELGDQIQCWIWYYIGNELQGMLETIMDLALSWLKCMPVNNPSQQSINLLVHTHTHTHTHIPHAHTQQIRCTYQLTTHRHRICLLQDWVWPHSNHRSPGWTCWSHRHHGAAVPWYYRAEDQWAATAAGIHTSKGQVANLTNSAIGSKTDSVRSMFHIASDRICWIRCSNTEQIFLFCGISSWP